METKITAGELAQLTNKAEEAFHRFLEQDLHTNALEAALYVAISEAVNGGESIRQVAKWVKMPSHWVRNILRRVEPQAVVVEEGEDQRAAWADAGFTPTLKIALPDGQVIFGEKDYDAVAMAARMAETCILESQELPWESNRLNSVKQRISYFLGFNEDDIKVHIAVVDGMTGKFLFWERGV